MDGPAAGARTTLQPWLWRGGAFLALFALLQAAWEAARGTWLERLWIDQLTVRGAAALIRWITPDVPVTAVGATLSAPGGGLNVRLGCEGADVVFLLVSAFVCFPMHWRLRLAGLLTGVVFVFTLNQLRVVGLFYAYRHERALFDLMHAVGAPLLMMALCGLFFHAWQRRDARLAAP